MKKKTIPLILLSILLSSQLLNIVNSEPIDVNSDNIPDGWSANPSYPPQSYSMASIGSHTTCLQITDQADWGVIQKAIPISYTPGSLYWYSYWLRTTESGSTCGGGVLICVSTINQGGYGLRIQNGLNLLYYKGQTTSTDSYYDVSVNQWNHIACSYQSTGKFEAYLNGVKIVSVNAYSMTPANILVTTCFQMSYIDDIYFGNSETDAFASFYAFTTSPTSTSSSSLPTNPTSTTHTSSSLPNSPKSVIIGIVSGVLILSLIIIVAVIKSKKEPSISKPIVPTSSFNMASIPPPLPSGILIIREQPMIIQDPSGKSNQPSSAPNVAEVPKLNFCPYCGSPLLNPKSAICETCGATTNPR